MSVPGANTRTQRKLHVQVRKIIRSGDNEDFDELVDSIGEAQAAQFVNADTCPTALQLAVLSNSTEMVKRVIELIQPENVDVKPFCDGKNVTSPIVDEEIQVCQDHTAREVAEHLIARASPGDKVRYEYIKSVLIRAGAKPKRGLFGLSRNNAQNVNFYKKYGFKQEQTQRGGYKRSNKTRKSKLFRSMPILNPCGLNNSTSK
jgi:hypothetical protein